MAHKVKFYIRATEKTKIAKIYIRFYNGLQFDLKAKTDYQIEPKFWNSSKNELRRLVDFSDFDKFQKKLNKLESLVIESYEAETNKENINLDWLKNVLDKHFNPDKYHEPKTLFEFVQHFIDNSHKRLNQKTGEPVCYKMRREYSVTFDYLKKFAKKYKEPDFVDIDLEFYQDFIAFLRKNNLATNTIGKKIQTLKIFLNEAKEQELNPYNKYKSKKFSTLSEKTDNIYLNESELTQFYEYDFSDKPRLERVRDTFIFGCWIGQRYSDWSSVSKDNIKGDFLELTQHKTGEKVVIPLHFTTKEILLKYDGKLPKLITNQKFNDYLKEAARIVGIESKHEKKKMSNGRQITKHVPKYELMGSHTARRSFCTNNYLKGIPTITIMSVSGHASESSFLGYIKADKKEHATKMLEYWNREQMKIAK
ncbi:MAG: site-specific integrase [Bacteroidetes bacterium]|jgi:integrase|nr:site-specific integrase [Bacteroidota bacterium]MBT7491088.1 site-specific integrase [Bacteroidota bacterium]